jgi:hypothetical protein
LQMVICMKRNWYSVTRNEPEIKFLYNIVWTFNYLAIDSQVEKIYTVQLHCTKDIFVFFTIFYIILIRSSSTSIIIRDSTHGWEIRAGPSLQNANHKRQISSRIWRI